jgi:hypothetical protein
MLALTCNLQWPKITAALLESNKPADRPDILVHVFQLKLDALVKEVEVDRTFGEMVACWVEVVSQKDWSRPQANILIFLKKKITTEVRVDDFVCAEVPTDNPQLREIVLPKSLRMVHTPCKSNAYCMKGTLCNRNCCGEPTHRRWFPWCDGDYDAKYRCGEGFPKAFAATTEWHEGDAHPTYRRRAPNAGGYSGVDARERSIDNRWVVPIAPT